MSSALKYGYFFLHPQELRNIIQWFVWHTPVHQRDEDDDCVELRHCFRLLRWTSRSFAAVIQELHPELLVPVTLFYLSLRGLDTIEDDMTIPTDEKFPLLREFHLKLDEPGWTYDGNHVKEKDRELLINFNYPISEFAKLKEPYKEVIRDITRRMGEGMASYAGDDDFVQNGIYTTAAYEKYCHYVAGLVGEGLTKLFVEADLGRTDLLQRPDLYESMGQFLQQTNIIRDIREDYDDKRAFWPKEIWSKHVTKFEDLFKKEHREAALQCSSEMVLNALERAPDCLFYLAHLREQSVFNFAAIPQSMAIATLDVCFRNPKIFEKNVKITKGDACRLMIDSSQNLQILYETFRKYARRIHKKNDPRDPNFLKISVACGRIEQFVESIFPSQDPKAIIKANGITTVDGSTVNAVEEARRGAQLKEAKSDTFWVGLSVFAIVVVVAGLMLLAASFFGARFDLVFHQIREQLSILFSGNAPNSATTPDTLRKAVRQEL